MKAFIEVVELKINDVITTSGGCPEDNSCPEDTGVFG